MTTMSTGRRGPKGIAVLITSVAVIAALAACSPGAGGDGQAASGLEGDPVKVMTYASVNYNGPTWENGIITAKVAQEYINSNGGINGRPLEVITCDEKGTAPGGEACAREAITENVVAVVGVPTYYGSAAQSVLAPAGISWFGACCSYGENEFNDPTAFTFAADPFAASIAPALAAVDDGCKTISVAIIDNASSGSSVQDAVYEVLEKNDIDVDLSFTLLPATSTDYSIEMAQAVKDDPDCIILRGSENMISAVIPALLLTGSEAQIYSTPGNFGPKSTRGFESEPQIKNAKIVAQFAPLQSTAMDEFRGALDSFSGDLKDLDYNSVAGLGGWVAYMAFADIARQIDGDITADSFVEQASKSTIDTRGMSGQDGVIDLANPLTGGPAPFNSRVFNRTYYVSDYETGEVVSTIDLQPYVTKVS